MEEVEVEMTRRKGRRGAATPARRLGHLAAVGILFVATSAVVLYVSASSASSRRDKDNTVLAIDSSIPPTTGPPAIIETPDPQLDDDGRTLGEAPDGAAWQSWSWDRLWQTDRTLADPGAVYADWAFHVYATSSTECSPLGCSTYWVPRYSGPSLAEPGDLQGDAMPDRPAWVAPADRAIWAPSVAHIGNAYVLYFAATAADAPNQGMKCLGAAVSATPHGPFLPLAAPLKCSPGYWNIDPYAVSDGSRWFLLWREDDAANTTGKIVAASLTPDGLGLVGGTKRTLLVGEYPWEEGYPEGVRALPTDRDAPLAEGAEAATGARHQPLVLEGQDPRGLTGVGAVATAGIGPIENPAMARHPVTGEWLLTWSANRWESHNYGTGLARCSGPLGPCERVSRDTPWLRSTADSQIDTTAVFVGSGGLSFVPGPDGDLYAVFHAYRGSGDPAPGTSRIGWAYRVDSIPGDAYGLAEIR